MLDRYKQVFAATGRNCCWESGRPTPYKYSSRVLLRHACPHLFADTRLPPPNNVFLRIRRRSCNFDKNILGIYSDLTFGVSRERDLDTYRIFYLIGGNMGITHLNNRAHSGEGVPTQNSFKIQTADKIRQPTYEYHERYLKLRPVHSATRDQHGSPDLLSLIHAPGI